ncbi:hypothetical protein DFAR_1150021 [Desulfarculales bacterium]
MVKEHGAEVRIKGFPCWTQFVATLFCHLARADFLREITRIFPTAWASCLTLR